MESAGINSAGQERLKPFFAKGIEEIEAARQDARNARSELATEFSALSQMVEETVQKEFEEVKEQLAPEKLLRSSAPLIGVALAVLGGLAVGRAFTAKPGREETESSEENARPASLFQGLTDGLFSQLHRVAGGPLAAVAAEEIANLLFADRVGKSSGPPAGQ